MAIFVLTLGSVVRVRESDATKVNRTPLVIIASLSLGPEIALLIVWPGTKGALVLFSHIFTFANAEKRRNLHKNMQYACVKKMQNYACSLFKENAL